MSKLNNKGQTLVMFILVLPVILMAFVTTVELGMLMTKTYKTKQSIKQALKYAVDTNNIEGSNLLLQKNIDGTYDISNKNGTIEIVVKGSYKAIFGSILKKSKYEYEYRYIGYNDSGKIIIKEE